MLSQNEPVPAVLAPSKITAELGGVLSQNEPAPAPPKMGAKLGGVLSQNELEMWSWV